jgi:HlyD family secretion protein
MKACACLLGLLLLTNAVALVVAGARTVPGGEAEEPSAATKRWAQGVGYVEPVGGVRRLSFKGNGVIGRCPVRVGDRVARGELLMALRNEEEKAAVVTAEQDLALARANRDRVLAGLNKYQVAAAEEKVGLLRERLAHARREAERARRLFRGRGISDEEQQRSATTVRQAAASLSQAEADLLAARHHATPEDRAVAVAQVRLAAAQRECRRRQLEETELRAPCDGQVLEVLKREGEAVRLVDSEPVALFADLSRLRVRAELEDRFIADLREGQPVELFGRGLGGRVFQAKVVRLKRVMGKKTVFTRAATERKDLDVLEVFVETDEPLAVPVGLQVDVRVALGMGRSAG